MSSVNRDAAACQAYLTKNGRVSVRIRIDGDAKSDFDDQDGAAGRPRATNTNTPYRSPMPELLELRDGAVIEKMRYDVPIGDVVWEVDVFAGENAGLVIAEVELANGDQEFCRPSWVGEEITHDRRFYNADLAKRSRELVAGRLQATAP